MSIYIITDNISAVFFIFSFKICVHLSKFIKSILLLVTILKKAFVIYVFVSPPIRLDLPMNTLKL